jgi:hypothetical protein
MLFIVGLLRNKGDTMNTNQIQWEIANAAIQSGKVTPVLWGEPGIGKTEIIRQICKHHGYPVITIIASTREPSDFLGLPYRTDDGVRFSAPNWAVEANRLAENHERVVIFFDEISTAPPSVQAAVLRIFSEKVVGDYLLASNISLISAANPPECAAGGWDLSPPLANRLCHLNISVDVDSWCDWISGNGNANKQWRKANKEEIAPLLEKNRVMFAAFMKKRPTALHELPKDGSSSSLAWPSPRSWDLASHLISAVESIDKDSQDLRYAALSACVGPGNAQEFLAWEKSVDIPDAKKVLKDPSILKKHLKRMDIMFAALAGMVHEVEKSPDKYYRSAFEVFKYLKDEGKKDLVLVFFAKIFKVRPKSEGAFTAKFLQDHFEGTIKDLGLV